MKPYIRVVVNWLRLSSMKLTHPGLSYNGIQLWGYNSKIKLDRNSQVTFGNRIVSDGRFTLMAGKHSKLTIGDRVYFNENCIISCMKTVEIGQGCRFGPGVRIYDNDHEFDAVHGVRASHKTGDIVIGKNCWIASDCVILRNTKIGDNCVIGAGTILKGVVPDASIVRTNRELLVEPITQRDYAKGF